MPGMRNTATVNLPAPGFIAEHFVESPERKEEYVLWKK
jgi:hypothetical protein